MCIRLSLSTQFEGVTTENIGEHEDFEYRSNSDIEKAKKAIENGFEVVEGYASWEDTENRLARMLKDVLKVVEGEDEFCIINNDLRW